MKPALNNAPTEHESATMEPAQKRLGAIRVLAFMEASSITGPAKNLIEFAVQARKKAEPGTAQALDVSIVTFQRGNSSSPNPLISGARAAGIRVDVIRERHAFDLRVIPQIRSILRVVQPTVIQTHNMKSHFLVWLARLHHRCPWIAFHHGYTSTDWKDRLYRVFDWISLPAAHHVITVCGAFASDLEKAGVPAERITIRHNTVKPFVPSPPEQVAALRTRLGLDGRFVLFSAGRLSLEKGHIDLVEAIAQLCTARNRPPFLVVIAGDGPERQNIEARSRRLGVEDMVLLVGHQPDLRSYYTMSDAVVLPSHSEGSPNVLLEAMAAAKPIVATAVGGVPEIVSNEDTALLVPSSNPDQMAEAIRRLLEEPELRFRLGTAAMQLSKQYEPEPCCTSIVQTYVRLLT